MPFDILTAGLAQATVKHLSEWLPQGRFSESVKMLRINFFFNYSAGVVAVIVLALLAPLLATKVFMIPGELKSDAIVSFTAAGWLWAVKLITATAGSVAAAQQRFSEIAMVQIASSIALYLIGIPVVFMFESVFSLQIWSIIVSFGIFLYWSRKVVSALRFSALLPGFDSNSFQKSFRFSSWQMLNSLLHYCSQQADRILIGILIGTSAAAILGIAAGIQQRLVALVWSLFATLFPALSQLTSLSDKLALLISKGKPISLASTVGFAIAVFGNYPFCQLWLGAETAAEVSPLLRLLFFVGIAGIPFALVLQFLLSLGETRMLFFGNIMFVFVSVCTSVIAIHRFGLHGAVYGGAAGLIASSLFLHTWVAFRYTSGNKQALFFLINLYAIPVAGSLLIFSIENIFAISLFTSLSNAIAKTISAISLFTIAILCFDYITFKKNSVVRVNIAPFLRSHFKFFLKLK
jgi:O-antigen/teichoic acid export membrane protein